MYTSDNEPELIAKIDDGTELCQIRRKPYFLPFMSERKQYLAQEHLKLIHFQNYLFFGGFDSSERKMLGLFCDAPDTTDTNKFPISALEFTFRPCDKLTHRDFLGTLMSLGIERETIGDILVEDGRCVVFIKSELKDYISSQIFKIGKVGVKIKDADSAALPKGRGVTESSLVVTSLRLDNIVAAACRLSREKTRKLILSGDVCVNYAESKNVSLNLKSGDVFTIRGKGKYILNALSGTTGKGRIRISVFYFR